MPELPPNSKASKATPKKIEKVASATAVRRRKPLGNRFREVFIGGDVKSAAGSVAQQVIVPAIQELLVDAGRTMVERVILGDRATRRLPTPTGYGQVNYQQQSKTMRAAGPPTTSRPARARHSFDELVLDNRQGAEEVLDRMLDILSHYEVVTVADLYELVGFDAAHTDHKGGWTALQGAGVDRTKGGMYLLNLPQPKSLD